MTKYLSKRLLAVILAFAYIFTIIPSSTVEAASTKDGWAMVKSNTTVVNSSGKTVGTVYAYEGVTVLLVSGTKALIEYATSGKPKRGYVNTSCFKYNYVSYTCAATVKSSCKTYYAASTNLPAGSLSAGETVAVLSTNQVYDYVEYNTTSGRKRAYVERKYLNYSYDNYLPKFCQNQDIPIDYSTKSTKTVYGGPSKKYATIGTVYPSDKIVRYCSFDVEGTTMIYIRYTASGHNKYGYIVK